MGNFRKRVFKPLIIGGYGTVTRVEQKVDENLQEQSVLVVGSPRYFAKVHPDPEVFDLQNKLDAGVELKEVNSVVFRSDSLTPSELEKLENTVAEYEKQQQQQVVEPTNE